MGKEPTEAADGEGSELFDADILTGPTKSLIVNKSCSEVYATQPSREEV